MNENNYDRPHKKKLQLVDQMIDSAMKYYIVH